MALVQPSKKVLVKPLQGYIQAQNLLLNHALLLFICGLLHERDFANAGAYLGEVRDLVERDKHPRLEVAKFLELQLARYAARR